MIVYNRGDVVIAEFAMPSTHLIQTKRRPVIIVQSDELSRRRADVIVVAVSTNMERAKDVTAYVLPEWKRIGLRAPSVALCATILTIPKEAIVLKLGVLSNVEMQAVEARILSAIGCKRA